jgi:hypothetical protein
MQTLKKHLTVCALLVEHCFKKDILSNLFTRPLIFELNRNNNTILNNTINEGKSLRFFQFILYYMSIHKGRLFSYKNKDLTIS